jgi:hypothetical protein
MGKKKAPFGASSQDSEFLLRRQHVYPLARPVKPVEIHDAVDQRKQGKVPAHAHVSTGVNARPELADDNITRTHGFTAKHFYATPLSLTVAPVTGAPASFFVCHIRSYF